MIKWIVIVIIGLVVLGYLGFDVRKAVESPTSQSNIEYVKNAIVYLWNKYLAKPAIYLWTNFKNLIWDTAVDNLTKIKNGQPTNVQTLPSPLPNNP